LMKKLNKIGPSTDPWGVCMGSSGDFKSIPKDKN